VEENQKQQQVHRRAELGFIIGQPETGKTWLLLEALKINERNLVFASSGYDKAWTIKNLKRLGFDAQVYAPTDSEVKTGYKVLQSFKKGVLVVVPDSFSDYQVGTLFFQNCARYFVSGSLLVDDSKTWILSKGLMNTGCEKILIDARHKETDVFCCLHGLKDLLGDVLTKAPTLYIKNTSTVVPRKLIEQILPEKAEELKRAVLLVKQEAKKNPYYCKVVKL